MTNLFDLQIYNKSFSSLITFLEEVLESGSNTIFIATPNPEQIIQAQKNLVFQKALRSADILVPDGIGLVWASRFLANQQVEPIKQRIAGTDVVASLLELAKNKNLKGLIVGGRDYLPGVEQYRSLSWLEGFADVLRPTLEENQQIAQVIEKEQPDLVFVAFGAPNQEEWVANNLELLRKNKVKIVMVVGGAFDFIFGKINRAPGLWQTLGLEWLWRLIKQPWRIKRQLSLVEFVFKVIKMRLIDKTRCY